jgi:hypothetical protein
VARTGRSLAVKDGEQRADMAKAGVKRIQSRDIAV